MYYLFLLGFLLVACGSDDKSSPTETVAESIYVLPDGIHRAGIYIGPYKLTCEDGDTVDDYFDTRYFDVVVDGSKLEFIWPSDDIWVGRFMSKERFIVEFTENDESEDGYVRTDTYQIKGEFEEDYRPTVVGKFIHTFTSKFDTASSKCVGEVEILAEPGPQPTF